MACLSEPSSDKCELIKGWLVLTLLGCPGWYIRALFGVEMSIE
jgi:hypothetical protein